MNHRSVVCGVGGYLPQQILTNDVLAQKVETSAAWIEERTGIQQRHLAAPDELTSDLGAAAAKEALRTAGLRPEDVDAIILATTTPDDTFPATAVVVQHKIGAENAFAMDVQAVCAGFLYALSVADGFIRMGQAKTVLVIGAETMSRIVDWDDRKTCVLFGDGAGAVVLRAESHTDRGVMATKLCSNGAYRDLLYVDGGPSRGGKVGRIHMVGRDVYRHAVEKMGEAILHVLSEQALTAADVQWFVPHQANLRIIDSLSQRLHLPPEKLILSVAQHANTSAASIPLALCEGASRIRQGDLVALTAIGGGLAWGAGLVRW